MPPLEAQNPDFAAANEPTLVIKEIAPGLRLWIDLSDHAIGLNIQRGRYEDLVAKVELQSELMAPLAEGAVAGKINISLDDKPVANLDLVTLSAVEEAGFMGRSWDGIKLWVDGMFGEYE